MHGRCQLVDSARELVLLLSELMPALRPRTRKTESRGMPRNSLGYKQHQFVLVACELVLDFC
jgi:hypothetical protein